VLASNVWEFSSVAGTTDVCASVGAVAARTMRRKRGNPLHEKSRAKVISPSLISTHTRWASGILRMTTGDLDVEFRHLVYFFSLYDEESELEVLRLRH
jgi:hypothetical protein